MLLGCERDRSDIMGSESLARGYYLAGTKYIRAIEHTDSRTPD